VSVEPPIHCAGCGLPIGSEETLWCQSRSGTIVVSRSAQLSRLLRDHEPASLFHLRCLSDEADGDDGTS
jgi:hypothetical protein